MKRKYLVACAVIATAFQAKAQEGFLDKVALEAAYGVAMPITPTATIKAADFNSLTNFQVGATYQINALWGVRGTYAYHQFEHKDFSDLGVTYHKFMAEATFNVLEAINPTVSPTHTTTFEVIAHAGIGGTFVKSAFYDNKDKMVNAQIGIKPMYMVTPRLNVFLDATYVANFSQNHGFDGKLPDGKDKSVVGGYFNAMLGLQFKLGK